MQEEVEENNPSSRNFGRKKAVLIKHPNYGDLCYHDIVEAYRKVREEGYV